MTKNIVILILILLLILTGFLFLLRENVNYDEKLRFIETYEQSQEKYLENVSELSANYNELEEKYNELYRDYNKLAKTKGFYDGWEKALCSAYTSLDSGCDDLSSIGININQLSKYFNFCAIDPEGEIDYGDIILAKIDNETIPFLAVDCGAKIKDLADKKRLDLYFVNDLQSAFNWGMQELDIKVVKHD